MDIIYSLIGMMPTPIKVKEEVPIRSARSKINGEIEVFPEFTVGLDVNEDFSRIYLLVHLNQSD